MHCAVFNAPSLHSTAACQRGPTSQHTPQQARPGLLHEIGARVAAAPRQHAAQLLKGPHHSRDRARGGLADVQLCGGKGLRGQRLVGCRRGRLALAAWMAGVGWQAHGQARWQAGPASPVLRLRVASAGLTEAAPGRNSRASRLLLTRPPLAAASRTSAASTCRRWPLAELASSDGRRAFSALHGSQPGLRGSCAWRAGCWVLGAGARGRPGGGQAGEGCKRSRVRGLSAGRGSTQLSCPCCAPAESSTRAPRG